ncbi:hypothetical protein MK805_16620 [Shimazuella sp. AN120528]|uniref:hypothetical protein n=1 Tax=Shimazuella soli TaxID=1892854 RepID=UPI001F0FE810|nr:hypothetical protein [Shimazuella soli]MCH5586564.1 hypothetical protein [Shimazuella soli]
MAFFKVGDVYRQKYLIESVVPFFQGELAIAVYEDKRYYLQSASLNRQAPLRAISQYRNLKLPQVIPYLDVFDEPDMLVFIRPYVEIRPLREIITTQELSEEQVVKWVRGLLHVDAVLRSKPMSMYLLLDLRNIGVDSQNELKVFFCGLEQIMVYESKLDWGTFIYSMLSGQFLDGPILKLPRNFKVSRPMARLIQKSFKEYTVPPVLEQVEIFENKSTSGGILSKFWGEKKEENNELIVPNAKQKQESMISISNRPTYRAEQNSGTMIHQESGSTTTVFTDNQNEEDIEQPSIVVQERGSLVKEDETKDITKSQNKQQEQQESSITTVFKEDANENSEIEINVTSLEATSHTEWLFEDEPLVGAKDQAYDKNENSKVVVQPKVSESPHTENTDLNSPVQETVFSEEPMEILQQNMEPKLEEAAQEKPDEEPKSDENLEAEEAKEESVKKESVGTHPDSNQTTVKVSPALAQLEGQDLSQSFVLKLNKQQEELEKEQEERLRKMREEYERRERELIEQHRKKLEEEQRRLLEEQRKKLEQQQEELLKLKREELARMEEEARLAKERKEKEERRKAKLAVARKQFEEKQKMVLEQEEQAFQKRQEELLARLHAEYEQQKTILLQKQEEEYQARTKAKLAELTAEWEQVEASTDGEISNEVKFEPITTQVTEESEKDQEDIPLTVFGDLATTTISVDEVKSSDASSLEIETKPVVSEVEPISQEEDQEIENVFAEVIPAKEPEPIKETKKQMKSNEQTESVKETESKTRQADNKQETPVKDETKTEAVFGKPEKVESKQEAQNPIQTEETAGKVEETTDETEDSQEASDEEAPKKKRRRRRRRRKKKSTEGEGTSTEEVAATATSDTTIEVQNAPKEAKSNTKETDPLEAERRRRELELQQMERELLEMEQQEKQNKPKVQKQEPAKVQKQEPIKENKVEEIPPKKEEKKETTQAPVVAKKPEVPVVKDTTEHATLAKQFEQYLQLFKRKK